MPSRQRLWQIKQQADGKCCTCGQPRAIYRLKNGTEKTSVYCERHLIIARKREHARMECETWQKRKPLVVKGT